MKRLAAMLVALTIAFVFPVAAAARQTWARTPESAREPLFVKRMGLNYRTAPTPPVWENGVLYVVSGVKLYALDAKTGEELNSVKLAGSTMYTVVSPAIADGALYMPLDGGIVQAFDLKTLTPLWIYRDPLGGQALCPVTVDDGRVYTGFWNGETDEANYVCLVAADEDPLRADEEKTAVWTYACVGGFYKTGAAVYGNWLIFGCDDGERGDGGVSRVASLDKNTGRLASVLETKGDLRSETVYCAENDRFYIVSKAGFLYRFACDPADGRLGGLSVYDAPGGMTAAPEICGGRLYAACQYGTAGLFLVLDADTLREIYRAETPGYAQGGITLRMPDADGDTLIYTTYNRSPGGLLMFRDRAGQTAADMTEIYTPDAAHAQYCISPVSVGADGTLYYKNDSGHIFAIPGDGEADRSVFLPILRAVRQLLDRLFTMIREWRLHADRF